MLGLAACRKVFVRLGFDSRRFIIPVAGIHMQVRVFFSVSIKKLVTF
jgi:hypothetical protein